MKGLLIAFGLYSRIPVPRTAWEQDGLSQALRWFPVVGAVIGALLWGWVRLAVRWNVGAVFFAAVAAVLPILVSGGIHMDGFCDTCDALSSHQNRERMLEIMKDPHAGAFAVLCGGLFLLLDLAAWTELRPVRGTVCILALMPVLSRGLSGLWSVLLPNARGSGMLQDVTRHAQRTGTAAVLGTWSALCISTMLLADPWVGAWTLIGAAVSCAYFLWTAMRRFGGMTGDLAGFFLQLCELGMLLGAVLGQKTGGLI